MLLKLQDYYASAVRLLGSLHHIDIEGKAAALVTV